MKLYLVTLREQPCNQGLCEWETQCCHQGTEFDHHSQMLNVIFVITEVIKVVDVDDFESQVFISTYTA